MGFSHILLVDRFLIDFYCGLPPTEWSVFVLRSGNLSPRWWENVALGGLENEHRVQTMEDVWGRNKSWTRDTFFGTLLRYNEIRLGWSVRRTRTISLKGASKYP